MVTMQANMPLRIELFARFPSGGEMSLGEIEVQVPVKFGVAENVDEYITLSVKRVEDGD